MVRKERKKQNGEAEAQGRPSDALTWGRSSGKAVRPAGGPGRAAPRLPGHGVTDPEGLGRRRHGAGGVGRRGAGSRAEPVSRPGLVSRCSIQTRAAWAASARVTARSPQSLSLSIPFPRLRRGCHWQRWRTTLRPGKGWKVSLRWPPSCTPHCLELHP